MAETLLMDRLQADISASATKHSKSYLDFLDGQLEEEVAHKVQRRIETTLKISGLPFVKTIDEYDFSF